MEFSEWATGIVNGRVLDSKPIPDGEKITAVEVKVQAGYGIIDINFHSTNSTTNWVTGNNEQGWFEKEVVNPKLKMIGLRVRLQSGFGIVDVQVIYKDNTYSDWITKINEGEIRSTVLSENVTGIQVREQAGFGIVDLRLF
ncbi:hypothetical protein I5F18_01105 [Bacillus halotolerans]|uniref:hypothetical protein n=1 Tax=Bacillus halotolerans TaxID=260554 RepID=UPI00192A81CC|nr:hypothetical protein [Bacillus halotolerans]MBL4970923.1 hypothetical protein [Bacillus halotolerans]